MNIDKSYLFKYFFKINVINISQHSILNNKIKNSKNEKLIKKEKKFGNPFFSGDNNLQNKNNNEIKTLAKSKINQKVLYQNIFDSLFNIIKIKNGGNIYIIEIKKNDISNILKPYLDCRNREELLHLFQLSKSSDFPKSWKNILNLSNLYPIFRFNK